MASRWAQVLIKENVSHTYNIIVYNSEKEVIITALKNIRKNDLTNLSKNYGWEL